MLLSWKNSCQGATVVPMIEMISRTPAEETPPRTEGTTKPWAMCDVDRWAWMMSGITTTFDGDEEHHEALPAPERARHRHGEERDHGDGHRHVGRDTEVAHGQRDADEFGHDDQRVEHQDRGDRHGAPPASDALA